MAIYHLTAKIVSRARGQSVVASAAYRSSELLYDSHIGQSFDYTRKEWVEHSEILAPAGAAEWVFDRQDLWNTVEEAERRKDSQLAREIEIALPVELDLKQQVELVRDFAQRAFVSRGMVVDFSIHRDNGENPHAHLLLTTRGLTADGFGAKRRDWNAKDELQTWRALWAERTNEHLLEAGRDIRIDHRTLEAQGIELEPGRKLGLSRERQQSARLSPNLERRVLEQRAIAFENGRRILETPQLALSGLTHHQATFTERDIARYLHSRTEGAEQFQRAYLAVTTSSELVPLGLDDRDRTRYTTKEMLELERSLLERAQRLSMGDRHVVQARHREQVLAQGLGRALSAQQREAFEHVVGERDLAVVLGVAGAGKSLTLGVAREGLEAAGFTVKGAALSGRAAEGLEHSSGIASRTLASWEYAWGQGRDFLARDDVLVIDEAGLIGTRQMASVLERAEEGGAKVILVGDHEQLQAIEAGAAFRGIAAEVGFAELTEVRRQRESWQKEATRELSGGRTREALERYERAEHLHAGPTRKAARQELLKSWQRARILQPGQSQLMLAYTRDDVRELNREARELRVEAGELGRGETLATERGEREFAAGDRIYFLKNERSLGVKNGSLGTVEKVRDRVLQVKLDGPDERRLSVDSKEYNHLEHGYAATVYKAQGMTVDRAFVLATPHFDRHVSYVALSRHREGVELFYGRADFTPEWSRASAEDNFKAVLSRARPKELAHDYLERGGPGDARSVMTLEQASPSDRGRLVDEWQQEAVSAWRSFRDIQERTKQRELERTRERGRSRELGRDFDLEL